LPFTLFYKMKKIFLFLCLLFTSMVYAQTLPAGYIGRVLNNTPGQWQTYSFTFTPGTTGSNYFMLAFRQDPAYWRVDNVRVTAAGNTTNMLTNGDMTTGGSVQVQTSGGTQYINAPTAWGVGYQNGTYPAAAGTWMNGLWYDGAVGSFDSIYQAVRLTAGVTYTIAFDVNGDNTSNGSSVQLGVYAGTCGDVALAPTECSLPSSSGFTQIATPSQTYTAGCTSNCPTNPDAGGGGTTWPATSDITAGQTTQRTAAKSRVSNIVLGNSLHLEQKIGSSGNTVIIEQTGNYNKIAGLGGTTYSVIDGDNNTFNIKQGDTLGKNLFEFSVTGNTNNITLWQARNPTTGLQDGSESGGHYMGLNITGSTNTLSLKQSNDGGTTSGHFAYVDVTGNNNQGTLKQMGNGEKTFFGIIAGNTNVFDITQQGSGSYFDLSLTGNGHSVTANQKDASSHKATVNLTNAGGSSTVNLIQQGSTAQNINITQQCATLSGCSVSVTQGTGP
jgi:hypothetical protein